MNEQVEEIKSKSDIVEIIGQRVILKKAGRHFKGLCPFHSEKSPSFIVSPERQSYKCFGCGEGGDVISFLQKYEGMSFLEALETLAKRVGITLESFRPSNQDLVKKRQLEIMRLAAQYYHYLLIEHKIAEEAREYLRKRGVINETRERFQLGYAPNSWRGVSDFLIKKKNYTIEELKSVGLVITGESGYYDRFRGRVMFPLRDHKGDVIGFSGRTLLRDEKEAKYINSPETQLYSKGKMLYGLYENREYIRKADRVVVVEGELDVIPSFQSGVREVVAIKGSAFTDEQARLVARYTRNVVFALDADRAGQEAMKRAVKVAEPYDLSIRIVQIAEGKDPGDVASENASKWKEMIRGSVLFYDFLIESACLRIDPKSGEGVKQVTAEVIPTLSSISNRVILAHYVGVFAKKLGVSENMVYEEIERVRKKGELRILSEAVKNIEQSSTSRREKLEEYLLSLILQFPELSLAYAHDLVDELFVTRSIAKIIALFLTRKKGEKIGEFAKNLPEELREVLDRAYLRDLSLLETEDMVKKEYTQTFVELSSLALKDEMKRLTPQISQAEAEGDREKLTALQQEFVRLSQRIKVL